MSNQSGVFLVGPDDKEVQLIEGQIAYAVDDTRGGVVFQLERGFGPFSTRVWWVPAGAGFADPILIAKPQTQTLALHDVVVDGDRTAVFYTRRDTPAGGSEIDYRATLRVFDLDSREVEELAPAGGFESGASPISFGGDWFVLNWGAEGFSWIEFLNRAGDPVEVAGNPLPSEVDAFDCASCAHHAELSPDGSRLAFVEAQERGDFFVPTLVITEMPDGDEIARVDLEDSLIHSLDFADGYVVISRLTNDFSTFRTPLVVDFNQSPPTITEVAVAGLGRIVRAPIEFDEVVLAPVTDG